MKQVWVRSRDFHNIEQVNCLVSVNLCDLGGFEGSIFDGCIQDYYILLTLVEQVAGTHSRDFYSIEWVHCWITGNLYDLGGFEESIFADFLVGCI